MVRTASLAVAYAPVRGRTRPTEPTSRSVLAGCVRLSSASRSTCCRSSALRRSWRWKTTCGDCGKDRRATFDSAITRLGFRARTASWCSKTTYGEVRKCSSQGRCGATAMKHELYRIISSRYVMQRLRRDFGSTVSASPASQHSWRM